MAEEPPITPDYDALAQMVQAYGEMGPPKPPATPLDLLPSTVMCACNKVVEATDMPALDTGVVRGMDNRCEGCENLNKGMATLVCVRCKTPVMWLEPHEASAGFLFEADKFYHTDGCPGCKPNLEKSTILEQIVFYRKHDIPYDPES